MVPRETVLDTPRLVEELAGCAWLHTVPSLMREIVRVLRGRGGTLPDRRPAVVGGRAAPPWRASGRPRVRGIVRVLRGRGGALPDRRLAFVGGEAVPPELLDEMREVFP